MTISELNLNLRTAVSALMASLGSDLDYVMVTRRETGESVTVRQFVDAIANASGDGVSASSIANELGITANPLTPHIRELCKAAGAKLKAKGRGPSDDPVKAKLGQMNAAALIAARTAALAKLQTPEAS